MKSSLLFILAFFTFQSLTQAQIITTVAGGGTGGLGDGGVATAAELVYPTGVAVDAGGNFYICERDAHRVRKVTADGTIITIAGTGTAGYSGDGGPATAALLKSPYSIVVDGSGNFYIGDQSTVRKVNTAGIISTFAGIGTTGYSGDGGPATAAELKGASGIAFDAAGNMYIADIENNRIRKIDPSGIITTIAGTGNTLYNGDNIPATSASLYTPTGVAVDNANNLFITDHRHYRVRKITPDGTITTVAGIGTIGYSGDGSAATAAQLNGPIGICIDNAGNAYFSDVFNACVRKIDAYGVITTIAGTGVPGSDGDGGLATATRLGSPIGVSTSGNNLLIADGPNGRIRKVLGVVSVKLISYVANDILKVYPNPNTGNFTVNLSTTGQNTARIVITDITGSVVKNMPFQTNEPIPITLDAPSGIYVITAFTDDGVKSQKITLLK